MPHWAAVLEAFNRSGAAEGAGAAVARTPIVRSEQISSMVLLDGSDDGARRQRIIIAGERIRERAGRMATSRAGIGQGRWRPLGRVGH